MNRREFLLSPLPSFPQMARSGSGQNSSESSRSCLQPLRNSEVSLDGCYGRVGSVSAERDRYMLLAEIVAHLEAHDAQDQRARTRLRRARVMMDISGRWLGLRKPSEGVVAQLHELGWLGEMFTPAGLGWTSSTSIWELLPKEAGPNERAVSALYLGRALAWLLVEWAPIAQDRRARQKILGDVSALLCCYDNRFGSNTLTSQYKGAAIRWEVNVRLPGASSWARAQVETVLRLKAIIYWWIDNRQDLSGGFGGGIQDDVEMWRWWKSVSIAFKDPKIEKAQGLLCKLTASALALEGGYSIKPLDVEHGAEPIVDTLVPQSFLPLKSRQILERLAGLVDNVWLGTSQSGCPLFRSLILSSNGVDAALDRSLDSTYHAVLVAPLIRDWIAGRSDSLTVKLEAWLRGWVDASQATVEEKPFGLLPMIRRFPSGRISLPERAWHAPFDIDSNEVIYNWPCLVGQKAMLSAFYFAYRRTADEFFLGPIRHYATLDEIMLPRGISGHDDAVRDLASSCKALLRTFSVPASDKYDTDGMKATESRLLDELDGISWNFSMMTEEVRWTDRVLDFDSNYGRFLRGELRLALPGECAFGMLTGNSISSDGYIMPRIRWLTAPGSLAAWVIAQTEKSLLIRMHCFEASEADRMFVHFEIISDRTVGYAQVSNASGEQVSFGLCMIGEPAMLSLPVKCECTVKVSW